MTNRALFVGWNRPVPGREAMAHELFSTFLNVLEKARKNGQIDSYEPVVLDPHGGELNGFVLIRGEQQGLDRLQQSEDFVDTQMRARLYLDGHGVVHGVTGQELQQRMSRWRKLIQEIS